MSYLKCANCSHKQSLPINKYRLIGAGISAFGALGWFSFLFAGSGHAFLISACIFLFGIFLFATAKKWAKDAILEQKCPNCGKSKWEDGFELFKN